MQAERRNPLARRQDEEIVLASQGNGQKEIEIKLIRRDGGTQPRDGINQLHVADMRIALQQDKPLPAVEVIYDGESYWLWDGFHRIEAHIAEERTAIAANVRQGTLQDAQWESYSVNAGHGLKRSNADKERQVRNALRHPKAQGMSNVQIAKHVGVDDKTVRRYRAEMESTSEIPRLEIRMGADGKERPASTPRPSKPAPPTIYPISSDLAVAGWRVEAHSAGGYSPILTDAKGSTHLSRTWSVDDAVEQIRAHIKLVSAPAPAPAPDDEHPDIELMAEAIRRICRADGSPADQRKSLLAFPSQAYYEALLPVDRRGTIEPRIYQIARERVLHELLHATRPAPTQPTPTTRPLSDEETCFLVWRAIKAEVEIAPSATMVFRLQKYLEWLARHSEPKHFKPHLFDATRSIDGQLLVNATISVGMEIEGNLEIAKRATKPTQPTQQPAVDEETSEAPPTDPSTLPADMIARGWELKQMAATGRWWCFNPNGPRATSPHDTIEQAAQAALGMQVDVARPAAKPAATDEVTMALQRIEEAVGVLVERLGLDMLRVRLDERQDNPWSLLASKASNELNWSHGNLVGVSSALVNLGRKAAK